MSPLSLLLRDLLALCCSCCPCFLSSGLGHLPLLIWLPFLSVIAVCRGGCFLALRVCGHLLFVYFASVYASCSCYLYLFVSSVIHSWRWRYLQAAFLLRYSPIFIWSVCSLPVFFISNRVPCVVWVGFVYRVTTTEFVVVHLKWDNQKQTTAAFTDVTSTQLRYCSAVHGH